MNNKKNYQKSIITSNLFFLLVLLFSNSLFSINRASKVTLLAAPANDNFASAIDLTGSINGACTSGGAYTTVGATADQSKGTCWSNGPNNNVWFKFTASATSFINVRVKVSGAGETMRNPFVAIFDGTPSQLNCQNYQGSAVDLSLSYYGLTAGTTYYIAVDNYSGYSGKFDICLSDVADYDYPQGAVDLTASINSSCITTGVYNTTFATADHSKGTCWSNGPNNNRWFKFTATATTFINAKVKVSGASETMRNPFVAIYDASLTQLACQNYLGGAVDLSLSYYGLIPGNTYYIAVDNYSGYTGTFDICLSDVVDYDYPQGAIDLTASINSACTTTGLYNTTYATADHAKGTCWSNGPNNNRWFKFTATATTFINAQVKVSGAGETMRNPFVAIYDASLTQLACQNYLGGTTDLSLSYYGLTPGNTYYIAVDNYSGYTGTFDICLSDVVDYDYPQGAIDLTASINSACATTGLYNTTYATADHAKGTCWSNGPNNNRWFKFTATATTFINAQVKVSGASETMRNPFVAIFDASLTQIACQNYLGGAVDLSLSYYGLTPGNTYYIAVDNYSGYTGNFDICLSDLPDYDYPQGAIDLTSTINTGCPTGGNYNTTYATADHSKGTCWSNGPNNNRWFKFTATSTTFINAQVKVSGAGQTMRNPFVAIFDASFTQIACENYQGGAVDLSLSYYGLTPGNTYYIAVDNYSGYTGTFDICLSDLPDYDYPQGAVDLTSTMNGCSTGGTYNTTYATADHSKGTCWSNGPNNNRWFKFTASATTFVNVQVMVSGAGETMRNPFVAIYDASLTQLNCENYQGGAVDLSLSYYGLTPGSTYYIAVDNYSGYTGTFDICISNQPDYDYPQGAVVLTNVNNYCSTGGTYATSNATADHSKGSCWSNGPNNNRWFTFQAVTPTVTVRAVVSSGETMRNPFIALWTSGLSQLACQNYLGGAVDVSITYSTLTVGNWYYVSVDNYSGYTGTFDICINNASSVQYYSIGSGEWNNTANWSTTGFGGSTAGTLPSSGNVVNIQDHSIYVGDVRSCDQINMTTSAGNTSLIVDSVAAQLTVFGTFNQTNGGNFDMITNVITGTLAVNNNANFTRSGGANNFQLNISTGGQMTVGQDMTWTSSGGTVQTNQMNINGTGILSVTRDLNLSSSGGMLISHTLNNSAVMNVGRDIKYTATAGGQTQLALNNTSTLNLSRNFVRGATPYGMFSMAGGATLNLVGSGVGHTQNVLGIAGAGGDAFNYTNLNVNNTSGNNPSVFVTGAATVTGALTLTSGVVNTTAANLLTLGPNATSTAGTYASTSYINGPLAIQKNTSGSSTLNFPIGKSTDCRPVILTVNHSTTNLYNYTAQLFNAASTASGYTVFPATVDTMSGIHYWSIGRTDASAVSQPSLDLSGNQTIQLFFGTNDQVYNGSLLTVCKTYTNSTDWVDIGQGSCSLGASSYTTAQVGSITSASSGAPTAFTSFSNFTLGKVHGSGKDPLPIELLYFDAKPVNNTTDLSWATATENGNHYFTIERSKDGVSFEFLKQVNSEALNGNSKSVLNYRTYDLNPYTGTSYYRLKQTDYNGAYKYSNIAQVNFDKKSYVSVYPNPTTGSFYVNVSEEYDNASLKFIDALGREVLSQTISSSNVNAISSSYLTSGIYYLIIDNGNGVVNKTKVILQK